MPNTLKRNDSCPCGSGKKYKHCCREKNGRQFFSKLGMAGLSLALLFGLLLAGMAIFGGENGEDCPSGTVWSEAHQHCH